MTATTATWDDVLRQLDRTLDRLIVVTQRLVNEQEAVNAAEDIIDDEYDRIGEAGAL